MIDFTNANNLVKGYRRTQKASGWKESNQRFGLNLLKNVRQLQKELRDDSYELSEGSTFILNERGHRRLVRALSVRDMVVQHALCDSVLVPVLSKYLIHDSGASLKNKGISFTRRRLEQQLRWYYRRFGTEGWVFKIDFRKYFDNVDHRELKKRVLPLVEDYLFVKNTLIKIIRYNRVDISFTDDPDFEKQPFNSLEYQKIDKKLLTKKRFMDKSLGIGAPSSQISGIFLPTLIDNYCKTISKIHCYQAYMDDRIVIHQDKEFLKRLLFEIKIIAQSIGIHVNEKKTQIVKLSRGFSFLNVKYILTNSGKIIKRIHRAVLVRQRRKMKKLAVFVVNREMTQESFKEQYESWFGDKKPYNSKQSLENMNKLYRRLIKWIARNIPSR